MNHESPIYYNKQKMEDGFPTNLVKTPMLNKNDNDDDSASELESNDEMYYMNGDHNDFMDFAKDHSHAADSPHDKTRTTLPPTTTSATATTTTTKGYTDGNQDDWADRNDELLTQLPSPWVKKSVHQGGFCYYNLDTNDVVWDINDITGFRGDSSASNGSLLGSQRKEELPKSQTRSPARKVGLKRESIINSDEPLTWKKLSINVGLAIHNLNVAAQNSKIESFESCTTSIVDAIRYMLLSSGIVDKDSFHLRTNSILRAHHRTMMASLSKLILSTHTCVYSSANDITKMVSDSNELLVATRNFIGTSESIPIHIEHADPQLQPHRRPSSLSTTNEDKVKKHRESLATSRTNRQKYALDGDLAENIETYGNSLCESIDGMINSIETYKKQLDSSSADNKRTVTLDSPRSSLSALLFAQFRNFSTQSGQFLAILDDTDFTGFQSSELMELDMLRQNLFHGVGDFFCKLQLLTDEDVPLDGTTDIPMQDGNSIKSTIENICLYIDKLAYDPSIRRQCSTDIGTTRSSSFGYNDNENDDFDADNNSYHTGAVGSSYFGNVQGVGRTETTTPTSSPLYSTNNVVDSSGKSESGASETNTSHTSQRFSITPRQEITSSLQRIISTSPDHPRQSNAKLKKFFGDDIPEHMPQTPPPAMDQSISVAGGPPDVELDAAAGDTTKDEGRPWYLNYDYKPNEIVFNMEGSVKGGTLLALVIRLTLHDYVDMNFINTFLLTYRSFCSTMELLKLLEKRYTRPPPEGLTEEELDIWMNKKLKLIRLRVFNVLKNWLEQYYNEDDYAILDHLLEFTITTIHSTLRFSAEQLERMIKKRQESAKDGLKKMVLTQPIAPPVPILPRNRKKFGLLDIDPLEMARQMTILDFRLYSSIRPVECLNKAWSKDAEEDEAHVAANIRASIEYCNQVTSWVTDAILSQPEAKKRVTLIKHWAQVAERCRQLNNFNTCMAILSAFDNSSVGRLKRTWEMVGARTNQILAQIRKLMGANRNFTEYRAIIHSINPPCIPFLGIYLQDLTFIEDGNSDFLKTSKDMINFAKRAKTAEVIREIQQYQSTHYQLTPVDEIQEFIQINLQSTRDEEQLYNESLKLEPR
ncbi:ras guanine nucleotide exchange factor domain-containing protein [Absidia repens]|uniref:Ras guanine nucleotide exchange factor domain-containing protein n=1 Tax=Absidia repens TaxID=90262 RepID=A0A1X2IN77_9FUNG|nr:ras guanine nucleotide exchange factor domain-containing protein [Absidia repens]